jgi:hypothetical protein
VAGRSWCRLQMLFMVQPLEDDTARWQCSAREHGSSQWLDVVVTDGAWQRRATDDGDGGSVVMWKRGRSRAAVKEMLASLMPCGDKTDAAHVGRRGETVGGRSGPWARRCWQSGGNAVRRGTITLARGMRGCFCPGGGGPQA